MGRLGLFHATLPVLARRGTAYLELMIAGGGQSGRDRRIQAAQSRGSTGASPSARSCRLANCDETLRYSWAVNLDGTEVR